MIYILLGSNFLMLTVFILRWSKMPPEIPLFYSQPWGERQLADWWVIFLLPIILNLLFFLNRYSQKKFFPENQLVIKIIEYLNLFLTFSFTLIFIKIILLIT
ncbi:MAG: hypothetical protein ACK4FL_00290 [Microgenomates group bacterium]